MDLTTKLTEVVKQLINHCAYDVENIENNRLEFLYNDTLMVSSPRVRGLAIDLAAYLLNLEYGTFQSAEWMERMYSSVVLRIITPETSLAGLNITRLTILDPGAVLDVKLRKEIPSLNRVNNKL